MKSNNIHVQYETLLWGKLFSEDRIWQASAAEFAIQGLVILKLFLDNDMHANM